MPYITSAEQGRPDPSTQIQGAAQAYLQQAALRQQIGQSAQAFPIEQQQRKATAKETQVTADTKQRTIELQQQAQDTQNQLAAIQLQFQKETDPIRKQQLQQQVDHLTAQMGNLKFQGQLLSAQANEATARGGLYTSEALKDNPAASPYDIKETPGKLDPYGNQLVHKDWINRSTGETVHSEDTFERGRGIPRVAYKTEVDPATQQLVRKPGVVEMGPDGSLNVNFPDEKQDAQPDQSQRTAVTDSLVEKYFDPATGQPKGAAFMGMGGGSTPKTAADRAALRTLLANPGLVKEYGLNAYANLSKTLGVGTQVPTTPSQAPGATPVTPAQTTPMAPDATAARAAKPARPSSVTSGSSNQDDMSRTGDGGPSGSTVQAPALTAPQDSPPPVAGVGTGGAAVKAGADAVAGAPSPGAVPIMSGRSGAKTNVSPAAATAPGAQPAVSGKKGSKFGDVPVGGFFMQNGVRYKKTSATGAIPAENDPAQTTPATPATQSPSLPQAQGM